MKVTKIEAQVKQKGRYSIYIDDKFAFGISELGLINSGLRIGQEFSAAEVENLKDTAKTDKIYHRTLDLIARRPRSIWEIQDYLKRKEIEPLVAQEIIQRLTEKNLVNDYDFAKKWVENRRLLKNISKRKLALELRAKRVSSDAIDTALAEDETDDYTVLVQEVSKKRKQTRYQDDQKLMQYLARQGYGYEDIKRSLSSHDG